MIAICWVCSQKLQESFACTVRGKDGHEVKVHADCAHRQGLEVVSVPKKKRVREEPLKPMTHMWGPVNRKMRNFGFLADEAIALLERCLVTGTLPHAGTVAELRSRHTRLRDNDA